MASDMIVEALKRGLKWDVIRLLAKNNRTPSELAKELKTSLQNVQFQLSRLEAAGMVRKAGKAASRRRPFNVYSLGQGFVILAKALPGEEAKIIRIVADETKKVQLRIWSIPQQGFHYFLEKFWWNIQENLADIEALAVYGSVARGDAKEDSDIDVLVITGKPEQMEKKLRAVVTNQAGESRIIMPKCYSGTLLGKSLKAGSAFARNAVKDMRIIYDPQNVLKEAMAASWKQ